MKTNDTTAFYPDRRAPARWMIVDDNPAMLSLMRDIVSHFSDAPLETYQSSAHALCAFAAAPEKYEFVITDLEMPFLNGIQLCHHLQTIVPNLKVLLATGSAILATDEAEQNGFCGLLHKPFSFAELQAALETAGVGGLLEFSHAG